MLPEGYGVSAKYPGDKGIAGDSAVLFAEDFEGGGLEAIGKRWQAVSNKDGKVLEVLPDAPEGSAGRHSLRITATLGVNEGGHLYTTFPAVDTAFLRFYVKFAEDAGYLHHGVTFGAYHPPTPQPQGKAGLRPEGDDRAHTGIEPIPGPGYPPPGIWNFYTYWQEMKVSSAGKYWGNGLRPDHPVPTVRGKWQCVEMMMKMNSAPEAYDGELALWVDGKLEAHFAKGAPRSPWTSGQGFELLKSGGEPFEGFRWRKSLDLKVNFLWLMHYVTEWAATREGQGEQNPINRVSFANVVVSREYVGQVQAC